MDVDFIGVHFFYGFLVIVDASLHNISIS